MSAFAAINIAKKQLGMEEDDYRSLLQRVTGKASLKLMTPVEHGRVLDEMRAKGAEPAKKSLPGPYGGKLQALWISGWNLGIVRNPSDGALLAFVKARTGIDHTRFLRDPVDARKAVEALKSWLTRDGGVDWSASDDPQDCVLWAQWQLLAAVSPAPDLATDGPTEEDARTGDKIALMRAFGERIRATRAAKK